MIVIYLYDLYKRKMQLLFIYRRFIIKFELNFMYIEILDRKKENVKLRKKISKY